MKISSIRPGVHLDFDPGGGANKYLVKRGRGVKLYPCAY